ncbi:50S ribosomal protein L25/general stress protein Ctc [Sulfitobacter guttiformis]|uniref:Large ribosomal subunit protein bL25 n=1 Tax=Sulfitobacter guttiformis TaxID=74349 RepID=A0A420DQ09_9RHOB|nr:50S ribosomal protein L25/general stress protein Ctc [Sulfitobacter guttiformis]KIN73569.1 50S ribosomal protein L25 [Sulfitobacter guttiformis KCTC 32187]RKE96217.1 large subunit ribosomal protein L25 [Sulfitobacter guttiformis]
MAGKIPDLEAQERTGTGKGAARQARRAGLVPGIIFGGDKEPLPITIEFNKLLTMLRKGRFKATLFNMKVEGHDDVRVICRDVQRHVVKDLPTHIDFMRLKQTTMIDLFIGVEVTGEDDCPGLRKGGTLNLVRPEIEVTVKASNIPDSIVIDISAMEVGDNLTISDVKLPDGCKPVIDRDFVIAQVSAPSALLAADDADDVDADEVPTSEMGPPDGE